MSRYFGAHTLEGEWHSLLPRYLLLADRLEGRRVLDIGCGTGLGSALLLSLGAERVDAIDHRPAVLEIARLKHARQGLDFHVMFWEELDFPDDTFDVVLCLDPNSPVTDPNLLLEMRRVLKEGGEYICAIERTNLAGLESVLPRYGYADAAQTVDIASAGERVPQLGALASFFETVVSVVQRPQLSFVFDLSSEHTPRATTAVRKVGRPDDSGLWVGDGESGGDDADQGPGRWIGLDTTFAQREAGEAAVELLFCGDSHMPPVPIKEIQLPYYGLIERLEALFSTMHDRQNPGYEDEAEGFGELVDDSPEVHPFAEREPTSQFRALGRRRHDSLTTDDFERTETSIYQLPLGHGEGSNPQLAQIQQQLDQMTSLYHQVRGDMEQLFQRTQSELNERDRYIEHLVHTVHQWQSQHFAAPKAQSTDADQTSVFRKVSDFPDESQDPPCEQEADHHSAPDHDEAFVEDQAKKSVHGDEMAASPEDEVAEEES